MSIYLKNVPNFKMFMDAKKFMNYESKQMFANLKYACELKTINF
jgi:hypothetical protein